MLVGRTSYAYPWLTEHFSRTILELNSVVQAAWRWWSGKASFDSPNDAFRSGARKSRGLAGSGAAVLSRFRLRQRRLWRRLLDGVHARLRRGVKLRLQCGVSTTSDLPTTFLCARALRPTMVDMFAVLRAAVPMRRRVRRNVGIRRPVGLPCIACRRRGHVLLRRCCPLASALRRSSSVRGPCALARSRRSNVNTEIAASTYVEHGGREHPIGADAWASAGRGRRSTPR